jgi:hypothetical protein
MENKMPEILAEFKKGQLNDASIAKMVEMANLQQCKTLFG